MAGSGAFGGVTPAASITRWRAATVGGDGEERFEFGLDMLIDGIARHAGQ